jgi:topoisomerase IA-like protein
MSTKKVTKANRYNELIELLHRCEEEGMLTAEEHETYTTFLSHEVDLLSKKNATTGERKLTKQQESNVTLKTMLYDLIVADGKQTISQLMPKLTSTEEITHGRVTQLLTQLRNEGKILREKKGKETFYSAVVEG